MLTKEQIDTNKNEFIELLKQIKRPGCDIDALINKLEKSDFFIAPASTQYHCGYAGGLCYHSLNVYKQLCKLVDMEYPRFIPDENGELFEIEDYFCPISTDSILITALLHDISKMNYYEISQRNVKDEKGNWVQVPFVKTREAKDRFVYSTHGVNSEYMIGRFIPLSIEESAAITNHMGGKEAGAPVMDSTVTEVFNRYPLAILLHTADMLATFIDESLEPKLPPAKKENNNEE